MNWFQKFILGVGSVLGHLFGSDDPTGVTTFSPGSTHFTTPVTIDPSSFPKHSPDTTSRIISILSSTHAATAGHEAQEKTVTGETPVTEFLDTTTHNHPKTTVTGGTTSSSSQSEGTTSSSSQSEGTTSSHPHSEGTTSSNPHSEGTTKSEGTTSSTPHSEGTTKSGGTTSSTPHSEGTTKSGGTTSSTPHSEGTTEPTDVAPTKKPGLSRGAVAGIVIGCLLLIAVVAAAVVFFVKNRSTSPEAQRLRV